MHPDDTTIAIEPDALQGTSEQSEERLQPSRLEIVTSAPAEMPKFHFKDLFEWMDLVFSGIFLIITTTLLNILSPMYIVGLNVTGVGYMFPMTVASGLLISCALLSKCGKLCYLRCPIPLIRMLQISLNFCIGFVMIFHSSIQENTSCFLQDPLKIMTILTSTFLYFFLSKGGLPKVVSMIVVVVGLVISSDHSFGGYPRCKRPTDTDWRLNVLWTSMDTIGFCSLAYAFYLMEEHIIFIPIKHICRSMVTISHIQQANGNLRNGKRQVTAASNVRQLINELKASTIIIAAWLQGLMCLMFYMFGCVCLMVSLLGFTAMHQSITSSILNDAACHIPGIKNPQDLKINFSFYENNLFYSKSFFGYLRDADSATSTDGYGTRNMQVLMDIHESKRVDRVQYDENSSQPNSLEARNRRSLKHIEHIFFGGGKNLNVRTKRSSVQTNSLGFKIIQPTDSILQGHVITNKLKPELVGHVILNKTNINLNGHRITFKQDLFIREHDPLPSKMHRIHRGRGEIRFANDLINVTENPNAMDKGFSLATTNGPENADREKREINYHKIYKPRPLYELRDLLKKNITPSSASEQPRQDVFYSQRFLTSPVQDQKIPPEDDAIVHSEIQFVPIEELEGANATNSPELEKKIEEFINYNFSNWKMYQNFKNNDSYQKMIREAVSDKKEVDHTFSKQEIVKVLHLDDDADFGNEIKQETKYEPRDHPKQNLNKDLDLETNVDENETAPKSFVPRDCGNTALYGWMIIASYIALAISSVRFLILSQSSTLTICMMIPSLPLSQLWWSLTQQPSGGDDFNLYFPEIGSIFIIALVGIPVIVFGLIFWIKKQMTEYYMEMNIAVDEPRVPAPVNTV